MGGQNVSAADTCSLYPGACKAVYTVIDIVIEWVYAAYIRRRRPPVAPMWRKIHVHIGENNNQPYNI